MSASNDKYLILDWNDFDEFIHHTLARIENSSKKFSGVYGLPRGGLVIATCLSHSLGIPLLMAPTENCLIVDDIDDSGESLVHYVSESSKRNYTILTRCNRYPKLHDHWYEIGIGDGRWVIFPWENLALSGHKIGDASCS